MSPDAATTWSAGSPPVLIACRRSFSVGLNPVVVMLLLLLVSLAPIIAFALMMVVDDRNAQSVNCHVTEVWWSCDQKNSLINTK